MSDDMYPSIGFKVSTSIYEPAFVQQGRYVHRVELHVIGPDEIHHEVSKHFHTKESCVKNLIIEFPAIVSRLHAIAGA